MSWIPRWLNHQGLLQSYGVPLDVDRWARGDALIQAPPELEELVKSTWQAWRSWGVDLEEKGPKRGEESVKSRWRVHSGHIFRCCAEMSWECVCFLHRCSTLREGWNGMEWHAAGPITWRTQQLHCVESSCRLKQQLSAAWNGVSWHCTSWKPKGQSRLARDDAWQAWWQHRLKHLGRLGRLGPAFVALVSRILGCRLSIPADLWKVCVEPTSSDGDCAWLLDSADSSSIV